MVLTKTQEDYGDYYNVLLNRYEFVSKGGQIKHYPTWSTLNKCCKHCGVELNETNMNLSLLRERRYTCKDCDAEATAQNILKRKHEAELGELAEKEPPKKQRPLGSGVKSGIVYVIEMPTAHKGKLKIGKTEKDADNRRDAADTWNPHKDTVVLFSFYTEDRSRLEADVHYFLDEHRCTSNPYNEWFNVTLEQAKYAIRKCERERYDHSEDLFSYANRTSD